MISLQYTYSENYENILINAGGDFSLIAGISGDSYYYHNKEDGGLFGKDKETTINNSSSSLVSGSIASGNGSVTINAGKESNIEKEGTEGSNGSKESTGDINIFASNITGKEDVTLSSDKGNVNILAGIEMESSASQSLSSGLLSSSIVFHQEQHETVAQSNIIAGNSVIINAGNNLNILASNLIGTTGELNANNNISITSLQNFSQITHFEQHTSLDVGSLALQLTVAVAVGALTAGAGGLLVAGATAVAVSNGINLATQGNNSTQMYQSGSNEGTTTITNQNVNSNLNFTNNLTFKCKWK